MIATDFTRDDCLLGKKRVSYAKLKREYRCQKCGGRIVIIHWEADGYWRPHCGRCASCDFIHEYEYEQQ